LVLKLLHGGRFGEMDAREELVSDLLSLSPSEGKEVRETERHLKNVVLLPSLCVSWQPQSPCIFDKRVTQGTQTAQS